MCSPQDWYRVESVTTLAQIRRCTLVGHPSRGRSLTDILILTTLSTRPGCCYINTNELEKQLHNHYSAMESDTFVRTASSVRVRVK